MLLDTKDEAKKIGCCWTLKMEVKVSSEAPPTTEQQRLTILITVQRDTTQSSLFIILRVHSTCFVCQTHPSSGTHKTVTTPSGTGHMFLHLPPSKLGHVRGR